MLLTWPLSPDQTTNFQILEGGQKIKELQKKGTLIPMVLDLHRKAEEPVKDLPGTLITQNKAENQVKIITEH